MLGSVPQHMPGMPLKPATQLWAMQQSTQPCETKARPCWMEALTSTRTSSGVGLAAAARKTQSAANITTIFYKLLYLRG